MSYDLKLNLVAVLSAIQLGVSTFLWSRALNHQLSGPILIMIVGAIYFIGGGIWAFCTTLSGQGVTMAPIGLYFGILAAVVYFSALISFTFIFRAEGAVLARVTAIGSTYPIITAILAVAASKKMLSIREALCIIAIVVFVACLSLSGKH